MDCLVDKCTNKDNQGAGMYLTDRVSGPDWINIWFCYPCWNTIMGKNDYPQFSQVYKNMIEKREKVDG